MKKIRILIADDHGIVRKGLRLQLEQNRDFEVVGEATEGREAVRMAEELLPDVVIMDIAMPNLTCATVASRLSVAREGAGTAPRGSEGPELATCFEVCK